MAYQLPHRALDLSDAAEMFPWEKLDSTREALPFCFNRSARPDYRFQSFSLETETFPALVLPLPPENKEPRSTRLGARSSKGDLAKGRAGFKFKLSAQQLLLMFGEVVLFQVINTFPDFDVNSNVNYKNRRSMNVTLPLIYFAIWKSDKAVVTKLLSLGVDPHATPISNKGNVNIVDIAFEEGSSEDGVQALTSALAPNENMLFFALKYRFKMLVPILESISSVNKMILLRKRDGKILTPLMFATKCQPKAIVDLLKGLSAEQRISLLEMKTKDGWTPLMLAARYQPKAIAALLKDLSAEQRTSLLEIKNKGGRTPLMCATWNPPKAIADLLEDLSAEQRTSLEILLNNLSAEQRISLLEMKKDDWTPLMIAARYQPKAIAALLKDLSAEQRISLLEMKKKDDWTPLMLAARHQPKAIAGLLKGLDLQQKQNLLEMQNEEGMTSIMLAAEFKSLSLVILLTDKQKGLFIQFLGLYHLNEYRGLLKTLTALVAGAGQQIDCSLLSNKAIRELTGIRLRKHSRPTSAKPADEQRAKKRLRTSRRASPTIATTQKEKKESPLINKQGKRARASVSESTQEKPRKRQRPILSALRVSIFERELKQYCGENGENNFPLPTMPHKIDGLVIEKEARRFVSQIEDILSQNSAETITMATWEALAICLANRWQYLKKSTFPYTQDSESWITQYCLQIATQCHQYFKPTADDLKMKGRWQVQSSRFQYLMPTIKKHTDLGDMVSLRDPKYHFHRFILSDNAEEFIDIQSAFDLANIGKVASEPDFRAVNSSRKARKGEARHNFCPYLSASEQNRLVLSSTRATLRYDNVIRLHERRISQHETLYYHLELLRLGLLSGGVEDNGEELKAAKGATIALSNFRDYFDTLGQADKQKTLGTKAEPTELGTLLNNLSSSSEMAIAAAYLQFYQLSLSHRQSLVKHLKSMGDTHAFCWLSKLEVKQSDASRFDIKTINNFAKALQHVDTPPSQREQFFVYLQQWEKAVHYLDLPKDLKEKLDKKEGLNLCRLSASDRSDLTRLAKAINHLDEDKKLRLGQVIQRYQRYKQQRLDCYERYTQLSNARLQELKEKLSDIAESSWPKLSSQRSESKHVQVSGGDFSRFFQKLTRQEKQHLDRFLKEKTQARSKAPSQLTTAIDEFIQQATARVKSCANIGWQRVEDIMRMDKSLYQSIVPRAGAQPGVDLLASINQLERQCKEELRLPKESSKDRWQHRLPKNNNINKSGTQYFARLQMYRQTDCLEQTELDRNKFENFNFRRYLQIDGYLDANDQFTSSFLQRYDDSLATMIAFKSLSDSYRLTPSFAALLMRFSHTAIEIKMDLSKFFTKIYMPIIKRLTKIERLFFKQLPSLKIDLKKEAVNNQDISSLRTILMFLKGDDQVRHFRFPCCTLLGAETQVIVQMIKTNQTLEKLDLSSVSMSVADWAQIAEAMSVNKVIYEFKMPASVKDAEIKKKIAAVIVRNAEKRSPRLSVQQGINPARLFGRVREVPQKAGGASDAEPSNSVR